MVLCPVVIKNDYYDRLCVDFDGKDGGFVNCRTLCMWVSTKIPMETVSTIPSK
jgi:hypothetical protein